MQYKIQRLVIPRAKHIISLCAVLLVLWFAIRGVIGAMRFLNQTGFVPWMQLSQTDGRTNLLLLGIPGGSHAGADLTDSMMILSINQKSKTNYLISLPRDIWSDTLKDKINSAYHYGEEKKQGGGLVLAKVVAEDVIGMPVHYGLVIDFSGFRRVIDDVGGVDVNVTSGFNDPDFPIEGKEEDACSGDRQFRCRYETLTFVTGIQLMDGTTALKYVRSRHAEGDEGSDFARNRRQQEVIFALKQKMTQPSVWMSPVRLRKVLASYDAATDTDMRIAELVTIAKLVARTKSEQIVRISLEDQLLTPPIWMYGGKYVLIPKEDYETLHASIKSKLN